MLSSTVNNLVLDLKPRQREIVAGRFGLKDGERHTLAGLGDKYGITRERVRQIEAEALKRYRFGLEMKLGMRQGIPVAPGQPGVSPSGMPPEMGATGASSPDAVRAALGVGSPGLSRRPQTPEERSQIVSTGGKTLIS